MIVVNGEKLGSILVDPSDTEPKRRPAKKAAAEPVKEPDPEPPVVEAKNDDDGEPKSEAEPAPEPVKVTPAKKAAPSTPPSKG